MWWIIGALVLVALLFILTLGARRANHQALVDAAQGHVRASLMAAGLYWTEADGRVWQDPYLLGYIQGTAGLTAKFFGGTMTTEQNGMVIVETLRGLNPENWRDVCTRVEHLTAEQNPEFQRGFIDAGNVFGLMAGKLRPEVMAEPDIQEALATVPQAEALHSAVFGAAEAKSYPYATAASNLMVMYMHRHGSLMRESLA